MKKIELRDRKKTLQLILKVYGNRCNIACEYCFENAKNVVQTIMTPNMLERIMDKSNDKLVIIFHGGEPLMIGKNNFVELLNVIRRNKNKVENVLIQSNGTLLDKEWIKIFFQEYKDLGIEISLSLDGTEDMNYLRVDASGNSTFHRVIAAYRLLETFNIKAGLLSVISSNSLKLYKEYISFLSSIANIKFVKLNALFNMENNVLSKYSITPSEYANFIIKISNLYVKEKLYKKFPLEPFLSIIQIMKGKKTRYCNYSTSKCLNFLSIYPDGRTGACDCLPIEPFELDIWARPKLEEVIAQAETNENFQSLTRLLFSCKNCDIVDFCNAGCLSQRFYFRNNRELYSDFCKSKHVLYNFAKKIISEDDCHK